MTDNPIFGGLTGQQLVERIAEQTVTEMRDAVVSKRGVEPSEDVLVIARTAARTGAVKMLAELQQLGMVAPAGWKL